MHHYQIIENGISREVAVVWYLSFDLNIKHILHYRDLLSTDELIRADKFKFQIDSDRYSIARGVLRILLGIYLNEKPRSLQFGYTKYGKPFLKNKSSLNFNLSHSQNGAVFGFVYNSEIGIDIEKIKNNFDVMEIAQNFFSKKEVKALKSFAPKDRYRAFYRCWTRKEAFIKAEGSGLSFPLDGFSVSMDEDKKANLLQTKWNALEKTIWSLFSFSPSDDYIGAIAIRGKVKSAQYFNWDKKK